MRYNGVMETDDRFAVDKSVFEVVPLAQSDNDTAYWLTRTTDERLEAMEMMRQVLYGYDPATERLQRVLEITKREPG